MDIPNMVKVIVSSEFPSYGPYERKHIEGMVHGALGMRALADLIVGGEHAYKATIEDIVAGFKLAEIEHGISVVHDLYEHQYDDWC